MSTGLQPQYWTVAVQIDRLRPWRGSYAATLLSRGTRPDGASVYQTFISIVFLMNHNVKLGLS